MLRGQELAARRQRLTRAIEKLELGSRVHELGAVAHDDMPRVIAQATLCVAPSAADAEERPVKFHVEDGVRRFLAPDDPLGQLAPPLLFVHIRPVRRRQNGCALQGSS